MSAEAKIRIGVEGADRSEQDLRRVKESFAGINKVSDSTTGILRGVAEGFGRLAMDAAKAANDMRAVNFGAAADKFKALDDQITRMAVRGGKNSDELRQKFAQMGAAAGVGTGRFAESVKQFDRMTFSGLDDAAESMKSLGVAAEDADMSIEEMAHLGADLYQKLGVPAAKIGDELKRIKALATDASIPGGLGAMAGILARLSRSGGNRVEGGVGRLAGIVGALREQGFNPEGATEMAEKILQRQAGFDPVLVRRSLRNMKGKNYEPYAKDPVTGRQVLKDDAAEALQHVFRTAPNPMGAVRQFFGTDIEGEEAGRAFLNLNYRKIHDVQDLPRRVRDAGGIPIEEFARPGGQAQMVSKGLIDDIMGRGTASEFSETAAGQRVRADAERAAVETKIGAGVQQLRDKRNARYRGQRTMQVVEDTATSYMPTSVQNAINLGNVALSATQNDEAVKQQSAALAKAADALRSASDAMKAAPQAIGESVKNAVRPEPLGAARAEARSNP